VGPFKSLNDIAVDRKGDLIVPGVGARTIDVFSGPGLCGPKLGSIVDPYGYPVVAAAGRNVQSSKPRGERIVVGHQFGGVSVCTLSDGCTVNLTTPDIKYGFGVAIARNGDCWASGYESLFPGDQPYLVYFARCQGEGVLATGFQNSSAGGLDIDDNGNLISLSTRGGFLSELYIYSGCDPACTLVGGPFPLLGTGLSVHLDGRSKRFVAADNQYKQLDVYSYSTTGIKYEYSITNGLPPSEGMTGAAFSPPSKE
jgi:hypothetical protein